MAQFYWSAANEVVGSGLSAEFIEYGGWEVEPHISDVLGRNSLRSQTTGSYTWRRIEWAGETPADSAVVALMRGSSQGSTSGWGVFVRGQGSISNAYALIPGGNKLRLWRTTGDTSSDTLGEFTLPFSTANNACYLELEAIGAVIRGRAWLEGSPRPLWQIVTEDTVYQSGTIGVGVNRNNTTIDTIAIGIGTNGDPAPMEPVGEEEPIHLEALSTTATAADARLTRRARLGATSESVSAGIGAPVRRIEAGAASTAQAGATASLSRAVHLSAQSVTTTGASLQASTAIRLRATAAAKTGTEAAVTRQILATGESSTTGAVDASLSRGVRASSESVSHTAAVGALTRSIQLSATSSTATAASLQVDSSIRLAAVATVTTSTNAGLTRRVQPAVITEATSGASAVLARRVRMNSRADTYTVAIADVLRAVRMVGSTRAVSAAHATLEVGDPLPHPTTLGVIIEDVYTLGVAIEDIYTLAAIIED